MGPCRDIKRDLIIEFLNRDTIRRSVIIKYPDIPDMDEFRTLLTEPTTVVTTVNKKVSYAQAASTDSGYQPAPVSKAKAKSVKGKGRKNNSQEGTNIRKSKHQTSTVKHSSSHSKQQETLINQHLASIAGLQEQLRLATMIQSRSFDSKPSSRKNSRKQPSNRKPKQKTSDDGIYYGGDGDEESQYEEDDDEDGDSNYGSWEGDMSDGEEKETPSSKGHRSNQKKALPKLGGAPTGNGPKAPIDNG